MTHVHASDGNCDCYYRKINCEHFKRCVGGCGRIGRPDQYGYFLCGPCERADKGNR